MNRSFHLLAWGALLLAACRDATTAASPVTPVTAPESSPTQPQSRRPAVVYLVMPDRFADGDPSNNERGLADCYDPNDPIKFHGGDLEGLRRRIDYLTELGVDTLWSTPLYRQAYGKTNWCPFHGYWADFTVPDDGAIEPRLGTLTELTALVEELRAHEIGFIADMIVNHPADHARIVEQRPDWFHDPQNCAESGRETTDCPFRPGASDFAQENPEVATYLTESSRRWVQRVAMSGIRMDTAKHVPPAYFRDAWLPAVREERPELFIVAEVFSGDPADLLTYLDVGFDGTVNYPLHGAFIRALAKDEGLRHVSEKLEELHRTLGPDKMQGLVNFLDNHDVPRFVSEIPRDVDRWQAQRRYHLALAALFTVPGVPQLYYGDELARYGGRDPDNRRDMPDWAFSEAGRCAAYPAEALGVPQETFTWVQQLVALRRGSTALRDGAYDLLAAPGADNTWAFSRTAVDERVVVVINAGPGPSTLATQVVGTELDLVLGAARVSASGVEVPSRSSAVLRAR